MTKKNSIFQAGRRRNQLLSLAIVAVLILLTFYTLHKNTTNMNVFYLRSVIAHLDIKYLIWALLFMAIFVIVEGQCVAMLARALGYRSGLLAASAYAAADIYFSAITPSATGGQPASAYYMVRDGIGVSHSTLVLVVNILLYTISLIIMGLWALAVKFRFFLKAGALVQSLFALGLVLQLALVGLCLLCMFSQSIIRKIAGTGIGLLHRMRLIRSKEEKMEQMNQVIENYQSGVEFIRKKPAVMAGVLVGNLLQRVAFFSIGWFVYKSFGMVQMGYGEFVAVQAFLAMAVNSLPVPGAIGVSEGSFMVLFQSVYPAAVLAPAMLLTRGINFYLCFILCGLYTLFYHVWKRKATKIDKGERK